MKKISFLTIGSTTVMVGLLASTLTVSAQMSAEIETRATTSVVKINSNANINITSTSTTNRQVSSSTGTTSNRAPTNTSTSSRSSISLPVNISGSADLTSYENSIMVKEDSVAKINTTSDEEVSVSWKHEGKLFAFIPVTVESETTVESSADNTANVTTRMPWWVVFVTNIDDRSNEIESNLEQSSVIKAYINAKTSLQAKAAAIYEIISELSINQEADITLEAEMR